MGRTQGEVEYATLFIGKAVTLDAIAVQNAGMGCQTGQDRGSRVALGPIEYFGQDFPVGFISQIGLPGLGTGDNHAIKLVLPELVKAVIKTVEVTLAPVSAWNSGERIELQVNQNIAGCLINQVEELQLRVLERSIGHVIDERDIQVLS
jgi:hypothetical protein